MAVGLVGKTSVLGESPNHFEWQISGRNADGFEDAVFRLLQVRVATSDGAVRVIRTRRSGDEGRDIEITFSQPILLGERRISPRPGQRQGKIYVECKATRHDRLDDGFLSDVSQHRQGAFDAYV